MARAGGLRIAVFDATERRAYEQELLAARLRAEESEARARVLVRTLQQTLLPPSTPNVDGLEIAAAYRPAGDGDEVGGDFYDVFQLGVDDWIVAVGDVTGKGVHAATVTALARYTMRAAAVSTPEPTAILSTLNDVLRHDDATVPLVHRRPRPLHPPTTVAGPSRMPRRPPARAPRRRPRPRHRTRPPRQPARRLRPPPAAHQTRDSSTQATPSSSTPTASPKPARPTASTAKTACAPPSAAHRGSAHGLTYRLLDDVIHHQAGDAADDIVIVTVHVPGPDDRPMQKGRPPRVL